MSDYSSSASLGDAIAAFNRGAYFEAAEMFETAAHAAGNDNDLKALIIAFNRIAAALHLRLERGGRQPLHYRLWQLNRRPALYQFVPSRLRNALQPGIRLSSVPQRN